MSPGSIEQIRWEEAGTVLYSRTAIEPHRFDREVRGSGRAGPRPAQRRRACNRHDPAPVSRDLHDPRPPRDWAGLLPRAPDRKRRGLESNRCGSLRGRLRAPSLAIDSADHPVRRIQRVPAVARATFATSHRSLRERDRAAPGRRRGGRPSNLSPPLLAPTRDWARRRLRSVLRPVARTDSVRFRILRLSHRGPEPAVPPLRGCAGDLELRRDGLGRPSNRTRGAPSPTRLRRSDARAAPSGITPLGATLYFFGALAIIIAEVTLSPDPVRPAYLAFLIVLVLFGAGLLFLPLVSIHRLMVTKKRRAIDTASSRAGDV